MAIRRIYETPDPVLRQISKPVETFDDELKTLVADMFETMYDAPGIGLAAVQVGEPGEAEVDEHGRPALEQDVGGLDVAMEHPDGVDGDDRLGESRSEVTEVVAGD
ncbi:MAG TPA: peptide deformylase, partial [Methyloceanibacter sp.]|nr:peptide deformylase [Methyloceanibacter sp.]